MDVKQRQWSGFGWALVAGCMAFALCCAVTATQAQSRRVAPVTAVARIVPKDCLVEFYAYAKVAEAANDLGPDGDIMNFALDDLQASLADCLAGHDHARERDASDDDVWPWLQAESRTRAI